MEEKLRAIPEIKHYKTNLIIYSVITFLLFFPVLLKYLLDENYEYDELLIMALFYLLIFFVPLVIYNLVKLIYFLRLKPTHIQEVTLDRLESKWSTFMCFKVDMNFFGRIDEIETRRVFKPGPVAVNRIDTYMNKRVLVGYDELKKKAVIVKLLDEQNKIIMR
jgi:hypothetical protein